jgi:hypothetical protein
MKLIPFGLVFMLTLRVNYRVYPYRTVTGNGCPVSNLI